jgi:hypothetical protein
MSNSVTVLESDTPELPRPPAARFFREMSILAIPPFSVRLNRSEGFDVLTFNFRCAPVDSVALYEILQSVPPRTKGAGQLAQRRIRALTGARRSTWRGHDDDLADS